MVTEAKRSSNDRYNEKCDNIQIRPRKEHGERIRAAAAAAGESLQKYILTAVDQRMNRDEERTRTIECEHTAAERVNMRQQAGPISEEAADAARAIDDAAQRKQAMIDLLRGDT